MSNTDSKQEACETPHGELCDKALAHYEEISNGAHRWNSLVPRAIEFYKQSIHPLFTELLSAFDATRMGEKGINQGCWCVQSPVDTNQPDWKHGKECKRNMKLLRRCKVALQVEQ